MSTHTSTAAPLPSQMQALRADLTPARIGQSIAAALIAAPLVIFLATSLAALVFGGDLSAMLGDSVGLILAGTVVLCLVLACFGSIPGAISSVQDTPAAIIAVMVASLAKSLPPGTSSAATFATIIAAISVTTLITGVALFALGSLRLGNLVRFLPYPVIGGFLASTGWLLTSGSIGVMAGVSPALGTLGALAQPGVLARWLPGLLLAMALMLALRRLRGAFVMPGVIIAAIAVFYAIAGLSGLAPGQLLAGGWLLGPFPAGSLLRPPPLGSVALVDWRLIALQAPNVVIIVLLTAVGTLLNATGLEMMAHRDVALNHELRVAGVANLVAGAVGGMPGYPALSLSSISIQSGKGSRMSGVLAALFVGLVMIAGASVVALIPKMVAGGLLMFLGLSFMKDWLWDAWKRLSRIEYAIIVLITAISAGIGFLEGVAAGVVAAIVLFVVAYSRVDVVRSYLTGAHIRSRVSRGSRQQHILHGMADRLHVLRLQGFIFFGTADRLLNQVRLRLTDPGGLWAIVLDFKQITGMDSTGVASFVKMNQAMADKGATLVIVEAGPTVLSQLQSGGLVESDRVHFFHNLDMGLEWCENGILHEAASEGLDADLPLREELAPMVTNPAGLDAMLAFLERMDLSAGAILIKQGDPADALYFVESGQLTAWLEIPGHAPVRLETMHGGRIVGEMGIYANQPRTATITVEAPTVVYRLGLDALRRMERECPQGAITLHHLCASTLATRVARQNVALEALQQ